MLRNTIISVVLLLATTITTNAQSHFTECASLTGNNATVLIPADVSVTLDGAPIPPNSELAVFTQEGLCAGVVVWEGKPTGFTIWGDDVLTDAKDGFMSGEALTYRVWDASADEEFGGTVGSADVRFSDSQPFYKTENEYTENAIYELARLSMQTAPLSAEDVGIPETFALKPNYPNPFNPSTTIQYDLPRSTPVRVAIYNAVGAEIDVLLEETMPAGSHRLQWEADGMTSGTYFCRVQAGEETRVQSLVLLK